MKSWINIGMISIACLLPAVARAGWPKIESRHGRVTVQLGGEKLEYIWLQSGQELVFAVKGPRTVRMLLRKMVAVSESSRKANLTLVRDDREQGTYPVEFPEADEARLLPAGDLGCTGVLVLKMEVPDGRHRYRLVAGDPGRGVLLAPHRERPARREGQRGAPLEITIGDIHWGETTESPDGGPGKAPGKDGEPQERREGE